MTWILAADAGELTDDEAQELAAEQRLLAFGERMAGCAGAGYRCPGWPRRAWNALMVLIPC